jgi:glycolate oxidase
VPRLPTSDSLDRALLELERALPSGRVLRDADTLETYSRDESETTPRLPDAVVRAETTAEIAAVLRVASAHDVPVTPRAGGTGRVGGAVPVAGGILLSTERMGSIKGVERDELLVVAGPGVILQTLHETVESEGLFYPPDPSSLGTCRLGGNVAANAGGPRAFKYGTTGDFVLGMEVVTADGTVLQLGRRTRKGVTGYDLSSLIVGSEGTLAVITEVTLRLVPLPERIATLLVLLTDVHAAARATSLLIARRIIPRCLELLDRESLAILRPSTSLPLDPRAGAMLLIELDGADAAIDAELSIVSDVMDEAGALDVLVAKSSTERERLWAARRDLSHATKRLAKKKLSEDVVVPRTRLPELLSEVTRISERERIRMPAFGHAGDGNIHVAFLWNDDDERPRVDRAIEALFRATVSLGGTLSGEHGIGVLKAPYLGLEQSDALITLQERVKATFDPRGILNPGKIFPSHAAQIRRRPQTP